MKGRPRDHSQNSILCPTQREVPPFHFIHAYLNKEMLWQFSFASFVFFIVVIMSEVRVDLVPLVRCHQPQHSKGR